jgi:class 3 adenylate cyclase
MEMERLVKINKHLQKETEQLAFEKLAGWMENHHAKSFYRMNTVLLAEELNIDKKDLLMVFLAGVLEGIFDLRWDYHCPHCNGIADFHTHLREVSGKSYCGLCKVDFTNVLDKNIEVTFSASMVVATIPEIYIQEQNQEMIELASNGKFQMPEKYLSGLDCTQIPFFREKFGHDVLSVEESLEIRSVTIMFTDIKGSTALYEKLGDAKAYNLVREHFKILYSAVESNSGVVIKTIGDAVMASFAIPSDALTAATGMRDKMALLKIPESDTSVEVKCGIHSGAAIVVNMNNRLDFFGRMVNTAARIQELGKANEIFISEETLNLSKDKYKFVPEMTKKFRANLKGIADEKIVYSV